MSEVVLYSTDCPKCKILKKKLDEKAVVYSYILGAEQMIAKGYTTAPMLEVDDKILGFPDAVRWVNDI